MPEQDRSEVPNTLFATGVLDPGLALTDVHLPNGKIVRLPTALLDQDNSQNSNVGAGTANSTSTLSPDDLAASAGEIVVPLIEERLEIGRRMLTTGVVRLQKTVHEFETQLDEPLAVRTFDIERVIFNQPVESAPAVRQEGDTTIYPLVEEQLILTKQLILKEELRVTRRDTERRDTQTVTLRREHLTVEREPVKDAPV